MTTSTSQQQLSYSRANHSEWSGWPSSPEASAGQDYT